MAALCNLQREVVEVAVTAQPHGFIVWRRRSWEAKGELENAIGQGATHLQLICSPQQLLSTLQTYLLTLGGRTQEEKAIQGKNWGSQRSKLPGPPQVTASVSSAPRGAHHKLRPSAATCRRIALQRRICSTSSYS